MPRTLPSIDPLTPQVIHNLEDLGKAVRNQRAQAKLRIDDAAALSFISSNLLSRLERGMPVNADKLLKVLEGLGLRMLVVPTRDAVQLTSELRALRAGRNRPSDLSSPSKSDD